MNAIDSEQAQLQKIYPWVICITGLWVLTVINGFSTSSITIYDEPLLKEFKWSRGVLKFREFITWSSAALLVIFSGFLIDRFGVKRMMIFGMSIMSLTFLLYSWVTTAWQIYVLHVLLSVSVVTAGSVATVILIAAWFKEQRGFALGLALIGTSLGGVIFPPLLTYFIKLYGWRQTLLFQSIIPFISIFLVILLVHSTPAKMGLVAFGQKKSSGEPLPDLSASGISYEEALKTATFWLIAVCGLLTFFCVMGLVSNTFLHARGMNFSAVEASFALSVYFAFSLGGKFVISAMSDYTNVYRLFSLCFGCMTVGALGYFLSNKEMFFYIVGFTALSWGGIYTLYNIIIVKSFGLKAAGKINGSISALESLGAASGPWITGMLFDSFGNYRVAFGLITLTMLLSTVISLRFNSKTYEEPGIV